MIYYSLQSSLTLPLILLSHSSILLSLPYFSTSHTFLHTPRFFFLTSLSSPFVPYIHKESLDGVVATLKKEDYRKFQTWDSFFQVLSVFFVFPFADFNWGGAHPLLPLVAATATAAFNHVSGNISRSKPQMI